MKKIALHTLALLLVSPVWLMAQPEEVAALRDMIIRSYQDLESLNTETGLSYQRENFLTDDYKVHKRVYYNGEKLVDVIVDRSSYLKDLDDQNSQVLSDESLKLGEIEFIQVSGELGIASFQVDITFREDETVIYKARETRIDRFKKEGNKWKYYSSTSDIIVTDINRSDCTYHLFSDGRASMYLKVFYPSGRMFDSDFLEVRFKDLGEGAYEIFTNKGDPFLWRNNELRPATTSRGAGITIPADTRVKVAEQLVMHYWGDQCASVRSVKLEE